MVKPKLILEIEPELKAEVFRAEVARVRARRDEGGVQPGRSPMTWPGFPLVVGAVTPSRSASGVPQFLVEATLEPDFPPYPVPPWEVAIIDPGRS